MVASLQDSFGCSSQAVSLPFLGVGLGFAIAVLGDSDCCDMENEDKRRGYKIAMLAGACAIPALSAGILAGHDFTLCDTGTSKLLNPGREWALNPTAALWLTGAIVSLAFMALGLSKIRAANKKLEAAAQHAD